MNATDKLIDGIGKLLQSNLLTAGRDIRAFLIALTENPELKEAVRTASDGFRFEEEFVRVFRDRQGLPRRNDRVVALMTALFYAIDTGELALADLLSLLYKDSAADGYAAFLTEYVKPYAESFVRLLIGEPMEEVKVPKTTIYDKMNEDVAAIVSEMCDFLSGSDIPPDVAEDAVNAAKGLSYALPFNDALLTRNAYRGLDNTLRLYGIYTGREEALFRTLKLYGVL